MNTSQQTSKEVSIQLQDIQKSFKTNKVFAGLSLTVNKGETLVLFGPSGAGKTVLLRLIAGVVQPDAGHIAIDGVDMHEVEPENRGVGMAFQNFALFPHMTAYANIASPLLARRQSKAAIEKRVVELAELLKIDHVLQHTPKQLSNGQKQRTALARALAAKPSILLLDDPLRNVDAKLRFEMRLELPRILKQQQSTVIYVTQDYKEAMALGDSIAVMGQGSISQIGTPEAIYTAPDNQETALLFGDPAINLLEVIPSQGDAGACIALSDTPISLGTKFSQAVGKNCVLGVRPEAIGFAEAGSPGAFSVSIVAETPLNEKTISLARTSQNQEILLSRPAGIAAPKSGTAHIAINPDAVLLFDSETGERIPQD